MSDRNNIFEHQFFYSKYGVGILTLLTVFLFIVLPIVTFGSENGLSKNCAYIIIASTSVTISCAMLALCSVWEAKNSPYKNKAVIIAVKDMLYMLACVLLAVLLCHDGYKDELFGVLVLTQGFFIFLPVFSCLIPSLFVVVTTPGGDA